jgi:hypothetical protein
MKLSDAMEAGWQGVPQIRLWYQLWDRATGQITGACAIGAACYAVQPTVHAVRGSDALGLFPQLQDLVRVPQKNGEVFEGPLRRYITLLNDNKQVKGHPPRDHEYTKEEIVAAVRDLGY